MTKKIAAFAVVTALLFLPIAAFAQNVREPVKSIEDINTADMPNDSIVVISKDNTDLPGYVHERFVFVHEDCPGGARIVDRYGPPVDPKDPNLQQFERTQCRDLRQRDLNDRGD